MGIRRWPTTLRRGISRLLPAFVLLAAMPHAAGDGAAGGCGSAPPYTQPSDGCHFLWRGMPFDVYGKVKGKTTSQQVSIRVWIQTSTGHEMLACEDSGKGEASCREIDPEMPILDFPAFTAVDDSSCFVEATVAPTFYCRAGTGR